MYYVICKIRGWLKNNDRDRYWTSEARFKRQTFHAPNLTLMRYCKFFVSFQGWIQHDLVGGCSASSSAKLCRSCVPPAHQLASLLQSLAWLLYLNCNCCSQFAYHHVLLKLLYLILSLIILSLSWKIAPPLARTRGVTLETSFVFKICAGLLESLWYLKQYIYIYIE
jgi:hypothetical protein